MSPARQAQGAGELAGLLAAHLHAGLPQDAASLETVRQALDAPDIVSALALLETEPEAAEHAPLRALIFSPGPASMRALEPALAQAGLDAAGARGLEQEALRLAQGRAALLLPGGERLELAAGGDDIPGFVRRLRPQATAPAELRALAARRLAPPQDLDLCVALRHCRLAWSPAQAFFVSALLERGGAGELPGLCAWALGFLDLCGPEFSPRAALSARRQALSAQLRLAEAQELAISGSSYEQRLSQGQRMGHLHAPDLRVELAWLDRACLLALGLNGESLSGVSVLDLGQAEDAEALLRLLGRQG